jgi:hypothetical protein
MKDGEILHKRINSLEIKGAWVNLTEESKVLADNI